jgi:nucleoid-associated protein YgaU
LGSLTAHLLEDGDHGRLGFHVRCPVCRRERLFGSLSTDPVVSRRVQAGLAAGALAFSTAAPGVAAAQEPDVEQEGVTEPAQPLETAPDQTAGQGLADNPDFDPGDVPDPTFEVGPPEGAPPADESADYGAPGDPEPVEDPYADDGTSDDGTNDQAEVPPPPPGNDALDAPVEAPAVPETPPTTDAISDDPASGEAEPPTEPEAEEPADPRPDPKSSDSPRSGNQQSRTPKPARSSDQEPTPGPSPAAMPQPAQSAPTGPAPSTPTTRPETTFVVDGAAAVPNAAGDTASQEATAAASTRATPGPRAVSTNAHSYTVKPGESLWSIAKKLLGSGATPAEIARLVDRLWSLNRDRIGTGNPDLLMAGTKLRLR